MSKKSKVVRASAAKRRPLTHEQVERSRWHRAVLIASVVPMLVGLVLFGASWFGAIWIGNATTQTVTGGLVACIGFALSNLVQRKWWLAMGWALLGVAVWLFVTPPIIALRWVGAAAGVAGLALVLMAFAQRYRQVRAAA